MNFQADKKTYLSFTKDRNTEKKCSNGCLFKKISQNRFFSSDLKGEGGGGVEVHKKKKLMKLKWRDSTFF